MSNKHEETAEWKALQAHCDDIRDLQMNALFSKDVRRFESFHIKLDGLLLDYSRHRITTETVQKLTGLARACNLESERDKMFSGKKINTSEDRAALHTALRGSTDKEQDFVAQTLAQIKTLSEKIRTGNKFTDVVSIGIGGSDLGPRLACEALAPFCDGPNIHFVANIDGAEISTLFKKLPPETTLFIVISKTFTTQETLTNAGTAQKWITENGHAPEEHFIGITANTAEAENFGIKSENILPLRNWIGGRYSVWSAVGLPLAIAAGFENFEKFLGGAKAMDEHFREAPLEKNMPVIMALLNIWYRNFFGFSAQAILPYAQNLKNFPPYLQQLEMESCGKSVSSDGQTLNYKTGNIIFGGVGTNTQHAFMQLLHQGTDIIPADFIIIAKAEHDLGHHHDLLLANALAQSKALMEGAKNTKEPHRNFSGNRPSSTLVLQHLDAYGLGMLLALYEHKVYVQGLIWDINVFDQWGVELGKTLAKDILQGLNNGKSLNSMDFSTSSLIRHIKV